MDNLIIATKNRGKSVEIKNVLRDLNLALSDLNEEGIDVDIEENGCSYRENALIKAKYVFNLKGVPVVADDSGLEVDALDGRPGLHSARYAPDTESKINKLLSELEGIDDNLRTARFICVACLYFERDRYHFFEGKVEGLITKVPRGVNGFGFDPVFLIPEISKTMAELPLHLKNSISHRAKAFNALKDFLMKSKWQPVL